MAFRAIAPLASAKPGFSPLEWSIVRLARTDGLSTIREPGVFRRLFNWAIGRSGNRQLANERLEALRRTALLSWHFGFSIPGDDVADFLSAGFTPDQYAVTARRSLGALDSAVRVETPNYDYYYLYTELRRKRMIPVLTKIRAKTSEEFGDLVHHPGEEFV